MADPFEESLRDMLKAQPMHDDDACLGRVLKTANRQVGAGDLFGLSSRWLQAVSIAFNNGAGHTSPVSRRRASQSIYSDKAD